MFLKNKINKIYNQFTTKISAIFSRTSVDEKLINDLSNLLISADTGTQTTNTIIEKLSQEIKAQGITKPTEVKDRLKTILVNILTAPQPEQDLPSVILLVGINGSGKTTLAGKLAHLLQQQNKKVLIVAGDTFRAAATQQLIAWATKTSSEIFVGKANQDPASVTFDACKKFTDEKFDHLIIDTAGRLQTKTNLMKELIKIKSIITRQLPNKSLGSWLTIDAMLGQNSFEQAISFKEATNIDGIVLTKLDGTGKGGIIFALTAQLHLPIIYVTLGEEIDAIKLFNPEEYVTALLEI